MVELKIHQLDKKFDNVQVHQQLSFNIKEGEFVSIVGPSGSGKSTLFHMIGGLIDPDAGEIRMNGKDIRGKRGMMSYMPQRPSLFPWRTILENVLLSAEISGQVNRSLAEKMLVQAGLGAYINAYPYQLSGGMQQRVAFIRCLLSPQKLLGLDEPFSALDEFTRVEMQQWLLSIWEENPRSILFITHHIEEAIFLSDRILILSDKPARIQKEISVPFKRPRSTELILENDFIAIRKEIIDELKRSGVQ